MDLSLIGRSYDSEEANHIDAMNLGFRRSTKAIAHMNRLVVDGNNPSKWTLGDDREIKICINHQLLRYQSIISDKNFDPHEKSATSALGKTQQNLIHSIHQNLNWINKQYENAFGIAEIRKMQERVLNAESGFVDITIQRKLVQDKIDAIKDTAKNLRDKLDSTPRQNESYLDLITQEHKLLREQLTLEVQLSQLKQKEQLSLDNLSKLLRQSHELERLRQERSKYWQIISVSLSLVGSFIALIAQRARSQKFIERELESQKAIFTSHLIGLNDSVQTLATNIDGLISRVDRIESNTQFLVSSKGDSRSLSGFEKVRRKQSWYAHIPGYSYLLSLARYLY